MKITPEQIAELRAMPTDRLVKAVQKLEAQYEYENGQFVTDKNAVAQGSVDQGVTAGGFTGGLRSMADLERKQAEYKQDAAARFHDFGVEPLKRRTERERVESMTKRLVDAIEKQPWEAELLLKGAALESWKAGHPVSYDDLRQAAQPLIEKAAHDQP